jgi:hypothetical protein
MNTKKVSNTLDGFILYYEEMEKKVAKVKSKVAQKSETTVKIGKTDAIKRKDKPSLMSRVKALVSKARSFFNNVFSRLKPSKKPSKLSKKEQAEHRKAFREQLIRGIIGIGLLLVVVSIAFSTYITNLFLDGPMMIIALIPQVGFAVITLLVAFYKILK